MKRVRRDRADDDHATGSAVRAEMDIERGDAQPERLDGFGLRRLRCGLIIECCARVREFLALGAVGEKTVVADAHEACGQHMQQETADELGGIKAHHFAAIAVGVVLVAKAVGLKPGAARGGEVLWGRGRQSAPAFLKADSARYKPLSCLGLFSPEGATARNQEKLGRHLPFLSKILHGVVATLNRIVVVDNYKSAG